MKYIFGTFLQNEWSPVLATQLCQFFTLLIHFFFSFSNFFKFIVNLLHQKRFTNSQYKFKNSSTGSATSPHHKEFMINFYDTK